jgi:hypothetical protein
MLRSDLIAGELLDSFLGTTASLVHIFKSEYSENLHIAQGHHADRLPNAETNTRSNATVKTLETILRVNVVERLADRQVLGTVRVDSLRLHLDTDDLDRLVPRGETTTERGRRNLLHDAEFLTALLVPHFADTLLRNTGKTEARAPVGDLTHGNGVDTAVDAADALLAINRHESLHRARGFHAAGGDLVLCDLHRLHARAEAHGGVCLRETADHAARDTSDEVGCAEGLGVEFGFRGDEEEDGALGGGFYPGPWNETLVDCTCRELASNPG